MDYSLLLTRLITIDTSGSVWWRPSNQCFLRWVFNAFVLNLQEMLLMLQNNAVVYTILVVMEVEG